MISQKPRVLNAKTWQKKRKQDLKDSLKDFERRLNKKAMKDFENRLNEKHSLAKEREVEKQPKSKSVSLEQDPISKALKVRLRRTELDTLKIEVMNMRFVRSYRKGRKDHVERLVRVNFEQLVKESVKVLVSVMRERYGEKGDGTALLDYNTSGDFAGFCLNPENSHGFNREDFVTTKGENMRFGEGMVDYMVKQFFEDEKTAKEVWAIARFKFFRERQKTN